MPIELVNGKVEIVPKKAGGTGGGAPPFAISDTTGLQEALDAKLAVAIPKTTAELNAMMLANELIIGQVYLQTDHYSKYVQLVTGKLKVGSGDYGTAVPADYYEGLLHTAVTDSTFDAIATSTKYLGHEVVYDFTSTTCTFDCNGGEWYADNDFDGIGKIFSFEGSYYRLRTHWSGMEPLSNTTVWAYLFSDADLSRPGLIKRRIDKSINPTKPVSIPWDYKEVVFARFKPSYTYWDNDAGDSFPIEVWTNTTQHTLGQIYSYDTDRIFYCFKDDSSAGVPPTDQNHFALLYWPALSNNMGTYCLPEKLRVFIGDVLGLGSKALEIDYDDYQEFYSLDFGGVDVSDTCYDFYIGNYENKEMQNLVVLDGRQSTNVNISKSLEECTFGQIKDFSARAVRRMFCGGYNSFDCVEVATVHAFLGMKGKINTISNFYAFNPIDNFNSTGLITNFISTTLYACAKIFFNGDCSNNLFTGTINNLTTQDGFNDNKFFGDVLNFDADSGYANNTNQDITNVSSGKAIANNIRGYGYAYNIEQDFTGGSIFGNDVTFNLFPRDFSGKTVPNGMSGTLSLGNGAEPLSSGAINIGGGAKAGNSSIAIGLGAKSTGYNSGYIGDDNELTDHRKIAIGKVIFGKTGGENSSNWIGIDPPSTFGTDTWFEVYIGLTTLDFSLPTSNGAVFDPRSYRVGDILALYDEYDDYELFNFKIVGITATSLLIDKPIPTFTGADHNIKFHMYHAALSVYPDKSTFADQTVAPLCYMDNDGNFVTTKDIEITDATKGIIMTDTVTSTKYRVQITSGDLTLTAI